MQRSPLGKGRLKLRTGFEKHVMQMYHDISGRVSCSMSWHVPGLLQSDVLQLLWPNHVSLLKEEARDQCFASRKDLSQEIYGQNTFIVANLFSMRQMQRLQTSFRRDGFQSCILLPCLMHYAIGRSKCM